MPIPDTADIYTRTNIKLHSLGHHKWIIIYGKNFAKDNASHLLLRGPYHFEVKCNTKMHDFEHVLDKLQIKGKLNNLVFSIGFQMLKI